MRQQGEMSARFPDSVLALSGCEKEMADNPMDVIYDVLLDATYQEMSTSRPAFVPVELVADRARIPDFEDWLECWMAVPNGLLRRDCIALSEFPVEEC